LIAAFKMELSSHLFWDVDQKTVSYDQHKSFIIPRVFMKGTMDDFWAVVTYYGKEVCQEQLVNTRYLDNKTLSFCCVYFNLDQEQFRCFKEKQSTPQHWNY